MPHVTLCNTNPPTIGDGYITNILTTEEVFTAALSVNAACGENSENVFTWEFEHTEVMYIACGNLIALT